MKRIINWVLESLAEHCYEIVILLFTIIAIIMLCLAAIKENKQKINYSYYTKSYNTEIITLEKGDYATILGEINKNSYDVFTKQVEETNSKYILVYINSWGGYVYYMEKIIETMQANPDKKFI
jgi:ATP-dependent protease ClpP protease subunit